MLFSVVTVVLNDLESLKITCESVRNQGFSSYEHVIVDGGSTDGTREYLEKIAAVDKHIRFISEKDNGIYDAMNKGTRLAQGRYIVILQAGDSFYTNSILHFAAQNVDRSVDVLYGKVIFSSEHRHGEVMDYQMNDLNFLMGYFSCGMGAFVRRKLLLKYPYDTKYRISADFKTMLLIKQAGYNLKYVDKILACYNAGFSANDESIQKGVMEHMRIFKECYPLAYYVRQAGHFVKTCRFWDV